MPLEARSSESQETASSAVPTKPSHPTPDSSQEVAPPIFSLVDENMALKQRLAKLESVEKHLTERVKNADAQTANERQRAIEAEKRTTAAEVEMNAAKARAQKRYTEMMRANNESRNLRIALQKQITERGDFLVGTTSVLRGLKQEILQLNAEKKDGAWAKVYTEQIDVLQAGFLAGEEDKKVLNSTINELNNTINNLRSDKEVTDKMLKDSKSVNTELRKQLDAEKMKPKAAPNAPTKEQIEAHIAAARAQVRAEAVRDANAASQRAIDAMKAKMKEHIESVTKAHQKQVQAQAQQFVQTKLDPWRLKEQAYREEKAALKSKLSAAIERIKLDKQRLETASGALQHSQQKPAKRGQQISPQEISVPNKRRRLDSYGAAGITTPDFQHTRSASFLSDTNTMSPRSATNTNGPIIMDGTQMRGQAQRTPNSIHGRQPSQQSNGSARQMTPTQRFSQQPGAGVLAPPYQQNGISSSQQPFSTTSPQQQQSIWQQTASNNTSPRSPGSAFYGPHSMCESPQLQQQMGNGQQTIYQPANLSSSRVQSQVQAQSSVPMQPTQSYTSPMPPPQPRAVQVPSKRSISSDVQPPSINQEASSGYGPRVEDTGMMTTFDEEKFFMGRTYTGHDWLAARDEQAKRGPTQTTFTPNIPSNWTPPMQGVDTQQPQQPSFQCHTVAPSQLQLGNPRDMSYGLNDAQSEPNMDIIDSRQPSVSGRETRASSRSTPAPTGRSRRKTPGPAEPVKIPCVGCYRHWWENECDEGEPCSNCAAEGVQCVRLKCINFVAGTCDKGNKCPNVHESDERYQDDRFLVDQSKAGKRPQRVGKKAEAAPAPAMRQQG